MRATVVSASPTLHQPLDAEGRGALARALGDSPQTVISVHLLNRGACRAYVAGDPACFDGAVIQSDDLPAEPMAFGSDAQLLWQLLQLVEGWQCASASTECAEALGNIIHDRTGRSIRYYGDVYHALTRPVMQHANNAVRRLTVADLGLFGSAPPDLCVSGFGSLRGLLEDGYAAGAVVSGQLVAIAHTFAISERHADIGVFTLEGYRRRGFASAAASIVARCVQATGRTPVWSTGEDNRASLRVAEKLGLREVSRRTYVIVGAATG